jgi:O-antigen ligase
MVILSIYLHLLAARTGLMLWYLFVLAWAIYYALKKNRLLGLGIIVALVVMAFLAVEFVPTLSNRVGYFNYMYILFSRGEISAIYSDMNRLISYSISTKLILAHPLSGVGAGDIMAAMAEGYDTYIPGTPAELKILPHNQFLVTGLAAGIPAMLLFMAWVFAPLRHIRKNRDGFFFLLVWLVLLLPMLVEPMLEIQFGVFVYLFFLLWQRQALLKKA